MQDSLLLMVEDEALTALSLQDALENAGFVVLHASDGHEAFVFLQDHQGKLAALITDIRFGYGLNGWAVARKARELNAAIPVLYISGDSAHEHAQLGVGRSIMLQKPFTPDRLLATLQSLLPPSNAENGPSDESKVWVLCSAYEMSDGAGTSGLRRASAAALR